MALSVLVDGLVAHLVQMAGPISELHAVAVVLSAVALAVLLVQAWVWSRLADDALFPRVLGKVRRAGRPGAAALGLPASRPDSDPVGRGVDSIRTARVTTSIVTWALAESLAVFGLVLSLLGADPRWFYPFGVAALADLVFFFPRQSVEEDQVRRWARYASMRGLGSTSAPATRPDRPRRSVSIQPGGADRLIAGIVVLALIAAGGMDAVRWWLPSRAFESAPAHVERAAGEVRVTKGHVRATFKVGGPISHVYRVLSMQPPEGPPFDFAAAELWGIPIEIMPEDRPFLREDFDKGEVLNLLAPTPALEEKVAAVIGTNLGWKKVKVTGRLLVPVEILHKGESLRGEFGRFVDLSDVEAVYRTP